MTVETSNTEHRYNPGPDMLPEALPAISFESADDLAVELLPLGVSDATVTLTRDADYAIGGDGLNAAGTITALRAFAEDDVIHIRRASTLLQRTRLRPDERLPVEDVEQTLDRQTRTMQEVARDVSYGLRFPYGEEGFRLPSAINRISRFFGFDPAGKPQLLTGTALFTALEPAILAGLPTTFKGDPGSAGKAHATLAALATAGDAASGLDDAALAAGGREGTFFFTATDLSAEVASDPFQGVFVPKASDPTGANGGWVRKIDGFIHPAWFGSLDDPATAHAALQAACDMSSIRVPFVEGVVLIPNRRINVSSTLFVESGATLMAGGPDSEIFMLEAGNAVTFGTFHPNHLPSNTNNGKVPRVTWQPGGEVKHGSYSFTLDNPADAAHYEVGDVVTVRSVRYYSTSNGGEHPDVCTQTIVAEAGNPATGVVKFRKPIQGSSPDGLIVNWTKAKVTVPVIPADRYIGPVRDVRVFGGVKFGSNSQEIWGISGLCAAVDSVFEMEATGASFGAIAINGSCFSTYRVKGVGFERGLEIKNHSCSNSIEADIRRIAGGVEDHGLFELGEGSLNNHVRFTGQDEQDIATVIKLNSCGGNFVEVLGIEATYSTGTLLNIALTPRSAAQDAGATQEVMETNTVSFLSDIDVGNLNRQVWFGGLGNGTMRPQKVTGPGTIHTTSAIAAVRFDNVFGCEVKGLGFAAGGNVTVVGTCADLSLDVSGALILPNMTNFRRAVIDGVAQFVTGTSFDEAGTVYQVDMSVKAQTVHFSGASLAISTKNSGIGAVAHVTLHNVSGGTVTPTTSSLYKLPAGYAWPAIPNGKYMEFTMRHVPGGFVILDPTVPF